MSSIRTQFTHKSIMLGLLFLGMLLNSQFESWSSTDAVAEQEVNSSSELQSEESLESDTMNSDENRSEVSMADFG
ncbi:hypothetical protein [Muriicola marianensis]|uniref:Uncharacterized protein n=1 Tax=Muriicola marianensis TaxID=1324801 RepID=A0ABQ1R4M9_9FLAO|nr:hypothetical protein [Muriicola marianensis]GGD54504.1 hypothetical protein GCM10011361_21420 [Muriicola marianensis]